MTDTIVEEIRKTRDEYAGRFGYDLHQMCLDLRRAQAASGATIVNLATSKDRPKTADQQPTAASR